MTKLATILVAILFTANLIAGTRKTQTISNDVISIDGNYAEQTMTRSERLKNLRAKLEKRTEQVVQQKIENLRLQQELKLTKKIQKAFNQKMNAMDQAFEDDDMTTQL